MSHLHVEFAAGKIVQEEEGLGSLSQDVIDTHGHQVLPDGVVFLALLCNLQDTGRTLGSALGPWNMSQGLEGTEITSRVCEKWTKIPLSLQAFSEEQLRLLSSPNSLQELFLSPLANPKGTEKETVLEGVSLQPKHNSKPGIKCFSP